MNRLRELRKAKNWTQEELALNSGLSQALVSQLERGGRGTTIETLKVLAAALDCSVADLLGEDSELKNHEFIEMFRAKLAKDEKTLDRHKKRWIKHLEILEEDMKAVAEATESSNTE